MKGVCKNCRKKEYCSKDCRLKKDEKQRQVAKFCSEVFIKVLSKVTGTN